MIDRLGVYQRFNECYGTKTPYELAMKLGRNHADVYQWEEGKRPIPWDVLKGLVDEQKLSWDWLIEGKGRKRRQSYKEKISPSFDRHAINQRYLSLFPNMSHAEIGKEIGVNPGTVSKWRRGLSQVPWERLKDAADGKDVKWEWLLEGR